jgi:MYXO-CTERM domain-containing protein
MKTTITQFKIRGLLSALLLSGFSGLASAVPQLQLGIMGGTYDLTTQTIVSASKTFDLYAFLNQGSFDQGVGGNKDVTLTEKVYISAALVGPNGPVSQSGSFGSFSIDGTVINVTSNMIFGTPPLDSALLAGGAALPGHSIFPTYFKESGFFTFQSGTRYDSLNTQDDPDLSGLTASASGPIYGKKFVIDTNSLAAGYSIHFDLYNSEVKNPGNQFDYDAAAFAPFSHDAQSSSGSTSSGTTSTGTTSTGTTSTGTTSTGTTSTGGNVSAPGSAPLVLVGLAMLGAGFVSRRRREVEEQSL